MDFETFIIAHILRFPIGENIVKIPAPRNTFGIFTTIRRSKKLNSWPIDIHGCIGYWDNIELSSDNIKNHLMDVSLSAMYNDNRSNYFPPIETDLESIVELDFMILPLLSVDNETGIISNGKLFNNKKWGLIVTQNNKKATYLPNVFPNSTWTEIKDSLIEKANIKNKTYIQFQAYEIKQISIKLSHILKSKCCYGLWLQDNFTNLVNNYITNKKQIPYTITDKNIIISNNDDVVRNLSVLELLIYSRIPYKLYVKNYIKKYIKYLLQNIDNLDNLELSGILSIITKLKNIISLDLLNNLIIRLKKNVINAERIFERGQIILALLPYSSLYERKKWILLYMNEPIRKYKLNDCFQLNWDCQVISKLNHIGLFNRYYNYIIELFININNEIENDLLETNQLAVLFECIMSFYKSNLINIDNIDNIRMLGYKILNKLMKRYKNNVFYFTNNNARLDITTHVINGFLQ